MKRISFFVFFILFCFLGAPLPMSSVLPASPVLTGRYEAVQATQPLAFDILDDGTCRVYGGENRLFLYGRYSMEDSLLTVYRGNGDDQLFTLNVDNFQVTSVNDGIFDCVAELRDLTFVEAARPSDLTGTWQMGKAFARRLVLREDMTYELWRPPFLSYLPMGRYAIDGLDVVLYEPDGWEAMRLSVLRDGFVVPEVSERTASFFFVKTGDVFVPLRKTPDVTGTYIDGDLRLELLETGEQLTMYRLFDKNRRLRYSGLYFAYNDRLFLTALETGVISYGDPPVIFEFLIRDDTLRTLRVPADPGLEPWLEAELEKQE